MFSFSKAEPFFLVIYDGKILEEFVDYIDGENFCHIKMLRRLESGKRLRFCYSGVKSILSKTVYIQANTDVGIEIPWD